MTETPVTVDPLQRPVPHVIHPRYGDGFVAKTPEEAEAATYAGYQKCHSPRCGMMINPEAQDRIAHTTGYYTCAPCTSSYHLHNEWPDYNPSGKTVREMEQEDDELKQTLPHHIVGGIRRSGYSVGEVGQVAENLVAHMGEIPGFGKITWWHQGGPQAASPLDGMTEDWGVEVKAIDVTAANHRFIAGGNRKHAGDDIIRNELVSKMEAAKEEGKKGVVGLLVILNFYTSTADVYAKAFPLEAGKMGHFRTISPNVQLIAQGVPFVNTNLDPNHPSPTQVKPVDDIPF